MKGNYRWVDIKPGKFDTDVGALPSVGAYQDPTPGAARRVSIDSFPGGDPDPMLSKIESFDLLLTRVVAESRLGAEVLIPVSLVNGSPPSFNFAISVRPDGSVHAVGDCVYRTLDPVLKALLKDPYFNMQSPIQAFRSMATPQGSAEIDKIRAQAQIAATVTTTAWPDLSPNERQIFGSEIPPDVRAQLETNIVDVNIPSEWRVQDMLICPKSKLGWSPCLRTNADYFADGHETVLAYSSRGEAVEIWGLGPADSLKQGFRLGQVATTLFTDPNQVPVVSVSEEFNRSTVDEIRSAGAAGHAVVQSSATRPSAEADAPSARAPTSISR